MPTGKLRFKEHRNDTYHQRAKAEGFAGRAIYKLQEIDRRCQVLRKGARVLDLGCWPGSWLQYAARVVGDRGVLVGIDRFALEVPIGPPTPRQVIGDVFSVTPEELRGTLPGFDVVLSDMAPDTSGIRHVDQSRSEELFGRALELAEALLVPSGRFVGKLFQGPEWNTLLKRAREGFGEVRLVKPESTRQQSLEQYVVGLGFKGRLDR